jgi:oxygen-independent coproporphyrinogen III oxidase
MAGIYFHIPFCRKACIYCNFHFSTSLKSLEEMVHAMRIELRNRCDYIQNETIETIYFGGGTPSVLNCHQIGALMEEINQYYHMASDAEITLEANPEDVNDEILDAWKSIGVNRLSIGVQSFSDAELQWMNRVHTARQSLESIEKAQGKGFKNISIDLIYGSKFQSPQSWQAALQQVEKLNVQHLSCYNLTTEERTVLGKRVGDKKEDEVDDDLSAKQFELLMDWSNSSGYEQYEISNFCKSGFNSRHNSSYWMGKKYLGIGPSAHSFNGVSRRWNVSNNNQYIKASREGIVFSEEETLSSTTLYNEYILTRLRTKWGLSISEIQQRFPDFQLHFKAQLRSAINKGFVLADENKVILSAKGKLLADHITQTFFI